MTVAHCNTGRKDKNGFWYHNSGATRKVRICRSLNDDDTCKYVRKCVSACDFQSWVLGAKHVQEEGSQTAQDAQETEGGDHPQQKDGLRVDTEL